MNYCGGGLDGRIARQCKQADITLDEKGKQASCRDAFDFETQSDTRFGAAIREGYEFECSWLRLARLTQPRWSGVCDACRRYHG